MHSLTINVLLHMMQTILYFYTALTYFVIVRNILLFLVMYYICLYYICLPSEYQTFKFDEMAAILPLILLCPPCPADYFDWWPCSPEPRLSVSFLNLALNVNVCAQQCLTLRNPMDCSPPGSSVHGISQARILDWVAISFSRGSSWPRDRTCISYVSCIGRWILYPWATGKLYQVLLIVVAREILHLCFGKRDL